MKIPNFTYYKWEQHVYILELNLYQIGLMDKCVKKKGKTMQWFYTCITYSLFFFQQMKIWKNDYQFKETFIKQQDNLFNQQINKLPVRGETDLL